MRLKDVGGAEYLGIHAALDAVAVEKPTIKYPRVADKTARLPCVMPQAAARTLCRD